MSRLRSRYVTVRLGTHGELPAVVESEDDAEVVLSLAVPPPAGLSRLLSGPVEVECTSPRGIQHVTGHVAWTPDRPERLRLTKESDDVVQRRAAVRVQAVVPIVLTVLAVPAPVGGDEERAELPDGPVQSTSLNLSSSGVLVRDADSLPLGTRLRLELELVAGEPPLSLEGTVVREGSGERGVHIDEMAPAEQGRLVRYITEKQRAELRLSRS